MKSILILALTSSQAWASALPQPSPDELGVVTAPDSGRYSPRPARPAPVAEPKPAEPPSDSSCPGEDAVFLPTGFTFPALLPDAVYSYNTAAPVVALLEDDVKFRDKVVLPRGTRLVGTASTLHTLDRVNLQWQLVVVPEGCEFNISAIALSADDGSAGVKGKVEKHEDSVAAHVALKSMLSAASVASAAAVPVEGALAAGFTSEASQNLDQDLSKVKSLESVYLHERMPIRVFVLRRFMRSGSER